MAKHLPALRRAAPLLVLAPAAFLRIHNLNWKSADNDEGFSWFLANRPVPQLVVESLSARGDPHPPVYWLTLKYWMTLGGASEFSMRLLSALAGTVFVALVFYLGCRLFSRAAALAAALFAALSAFLIWNSQDARMYTLGGTLALAGIVCLVNAFRSKRAFWWLGYYLFTTLACYTHLAASFLLPFEGVLILVALRGRFHQAWKPAFIALAAIGFTFLPFAWNVWQVSGPGHNVLREPLRFDQLLYNATLQLSTYERALPSGQAWGVVLFVGGVFSWGMIGGREAPWAPRGFARLLTALHYLLFLLVMIILSLREPVYQPKSLTFVGATLALGVGAGWARLWRWRRVAGGVVGALLIAVQFYGIGGLWRLEMYKEDWRHAVAYVARQVGPDDMVLVHLEYYQVVFRYYFRGTTPVIAPFGSHLPAPEEIDRILRQYQNHAVIWLTQSGEYITDQEHRVQKWLESQYPEVTEVYPSGILIKGFAVRYRTASLPSAATPAAARYPNGLALVGYRVPESSLPVRDIFLHPPSTWVHVTLYWSVAQSLTEDIRVAITLEDEGGNVWGSDLPRAGDLRAFYPPLQWQPGEIIRQDFDVNTNPAVPPGEYKLVLRVFPAGSDIPLLSDSGEDWRSLSPIILTR